MAEKSIRSSILHNRKSIMGFSALWIYFFHCYNLLLGDTALRSLEWFAKRSGYAGVDIFFMLSGMGLVYSVRKSSVLKFYVTRLKKVGIPFLLTAIFIAICDGWSFLEFIQKVSGYKFLFENMYSFLWFVTAIMICYVFFPLIHKAFDKRKNKLLTLIVMLLIWYISSMIVKEHLRSDLWGATNRIPIFIIGVYLAEENNTRYFTWKPYYYLVYGVVLVVGFSAQHFCNGGMYLLVPNSNCCVPNILLSISLCVLLSRIFDELKEKNYKKINGVLHGFLGFFGSITLELYCVQEWVFYRYNSVMIERFGEVFTNILMLLMVTALALALSYASKALRKLIDLSFAKRRTA